MGQISAQDYSVHLVDRISIYAPRRLDDEKLSPPPAGVVRLTAISRYLRSNGQLWRKGRGSVRRRRRRRRGKGGSLAAPG